MSKIGQGACIVCGGGRRRTGTVRYPFPRWIQRGSQAGAVLVNHAVVYPYPPLCKGFVLSRSRPPNRDSLTGISKSGCPLPPPGVPFPRPLPLEQKWVSPSPRGEHLSRTQSAAFPRLDRLISPIGLGHRLISGADFRRRSRPAFSARKGKKEKG